MIDLQDDAVDRHWSQSDRRLSQMLDTLQATEYWPLDDHDDIKNAITAWASPLDGARVETLVIKQPDDVVCVLAYMACKRSLYMLHKMEALFPGATMELLQASLQDIDDELDDHRVQHIFRDRLLALLRADLLERIFSGERCRNIKLAIETTVERHGGLLDA